MATEILGSSYTVHMAAGPFPPLDPTTFSPQLIWLVISFVALYFIMSRLALPRIGAAIEQRHSKIADDLDEARSLKNQTEKAIADYETALADARAKAHAIAQENRDKLNAEIDAERTRVDAGIADKVAAAEKSIAATKAQALSEVQRVANDVAGDIVNQLTGIKASRTEIAGAIERVAGGRG